GGGGGGGGRGRWGAGAAGGDQRERGVLLPGAATGLRGAAGFPPLAGARRERYLAAARRLGEPAIARLWAQGLAMSGEAAVALALDVPQGAAGGRGTVTLAAVRAPGAVLPRPLAPPGRHGAGAVARGP